MMNRRQFIGNAVACSAAAGLSAAWPRSVLASIPAKTRTVGTAHRASVVDFGADPSGVRDATDAVQRAIASLSLSEARLVFPPGKYSFAVSDAPVMLFRNYNGLEVFGNGAELIFNGNTQPLLLDTCRGVEIHDIKIDWARPAFSQGTVQTVQDVVGDAKAQSFTVLIDSDFPVDGSETIEAVSEYDPKTALPAVDGLDVSALGAAGVVSSVRLIAPQTLAVACTRPLGVKTGMRLVLRHRTAGASCMHLEACETVLLESVVLYGGPGKGAVLHGCRDVSLEDFSVTPRPQTSRWLSLCGRGVEMMGCEGTIAIERCQFKGMGEDALQMFQPYWKIRQRIDEKTVLIEGAGAGPLPKWQLPLMGTILQLTDARTLNLLGEIATESAENTPSGTRLSFSESLSPLIGSGTLLCSVLKQARAKIERSAFLGNRGCGVVAHARTRIVNSRFHGCSGPAVLFASDPNAMEGPAVQSVGVTDSTFDFCNYGGQAERRGVVTVGTVRDGKLTGTPSQQMNEGVTVARNFFGNVTGPAIDCTGTSWLNVEGNSFGKCDVTAGANGKPRAIVLRNVDQTQVDGNQSKLAQEIVLINCTDKVATENNSLLVAVKA